MSSSAEKGEEFFWRFVIADDASTDDTLVATKATLERLNIVCDLDGKAVGDESSFEIIGTKMSAAIANCHVFFVDMDWDQSGGEKLRKGFLDELSRIGELLPAEFEKWCRNFGGLNPPKSENTVYVDDAWVGYWLAAAASHLNPTMSIVLYTGSPEVQTDARSLALTSFRPAPYAIQRKALRQAIADEVIAEQLEILQTKSVRLQTEVRRWLVQKVLLPVLFGREPLDETVDAGLTPNSPGHHHLRASNVFPQFFSLKALETEKTLSESARLNNSAERISKLATMLPQEPFQISRKQRANLLAIEHAVRKLDRETSRSGAVYEELERWCSECGFAGAPIWKHLERAKYSGDPVHRNKLAQAAGKIARNSTAELFDLCQANNGRFDCAQTDSRVKSPSYDGRSLADKEVTGALPFDLSDFERVLSALKDNLSKCRPGESGRHTLECTECDALLTLTYQDNSDGFETLDSMAESVISSLDKKDALMRGLPMALVFPFFYPFERVEIMTNDGKWNFLYPPRIEKRDGGSDWRYGIRWTFRMR